MGKYFTVEVKPTITAISQELGAYTAGDLVFDWTSFQVPRGANKLISITAIFRGTDGGTQTARDMDYYFAKSINGTAPATLGTGNATITAVPAVANHILGMAHIDGAGDWGNGAFDYFATSQTGSGAAASLIPNFVLEGDPDSGDNVGYDTLYIGASVGNNSLNFGTTVKARGAISSGGFSCEVDGASDGDDPNAELKFAPGDVIHSGTGDVLGTLSAIGAFDSDHQDLVFTTTIADAVANNEELYNINPMRIILSFEK